MKKQSIPCLLIALLIGMAASAQDIHFSQFYETPLYRNPALAGIVTGDIRVQTVYRSQWNSIANAYKTASLNAEYKVHVVNDDYMTLGVQTFYDKAGTTNLTTTHLLPAINYHKSISNERNQYISVGFMGGLVQRSFDRSKITTNSQYNGGADMENTAQSQYSYLDGSAGISFNSGLNDNPDDNLVVGVAYHHFNQPKSSFFTNNGIVLSPKWDFSADVRFGLDETSFLTIHTDHLRQGVYQETVGGLLYGLKIGPYSDDPDYILSAGAFMRLNDAIIPTIKVDYKPFAFALSYDINLSKLADNSYGRGGFELSLTYIGFTHRESSTENAVRCPRF
jgi:type IX secretion system PorP/SprF family membrane protein